jgi:cytidylate kinase
MKADPVVRATRRFDELMKKGVKVSLQEVKDNLIARDYEDSNREESPLRKAADAVILDNTHMDQEQQIEFVMDIVKSLVNADKPADS